MKKVLSLFVLFVGFVVCSVSFAADLTVTASVNGSCTITPGYLVFGNYMSGQVSAKEVIGGGAANVSNNGGIGVVCDGAESWRVYLGQGLHYDNANSTRRIESSYNGSSNYLTYNLYKDSSYSTVWGDSSMGDSMGVSGVGTGVVPIYGKMPAGQSSLAPAGTQFSDTVVETIEY